MHKITEYEIIDHGIMHPDYFQGCGIACTDYDQVATGIGDNPQEALDDCLEVIAQSGDYDLSALETEIEDAPTEPSVEYNEDDDEDAEESPYYYVSIRWRN